MLSDSQGSGSMDVNRSKFQELEEIKRYGKLTWYQLGLNYSNDWSRYCCVFSSTFYFELMEIHSKLKQRRRVENVAQLSGFPCMHEALDLIPSTADGARCYCGWVRCCVCLGKGGVS